MKPQLTTVFAGIVLAIVAILVVPLPPPLLDGLLALNIFGSALVLLLSLRVEEPLEFSAFAPSLLLATLFRLSLDVSATRLILTQGHEPGGVGSVIPAFGAFVVRGNLVVGLIVFAILITIQFVVIATGAQRVAEVCARFTLDAMPGKQMAIDADVHAGVLDAEGARRKRARVQREADFYAAMDGAGKFVKGDAIAALVIVALNLVGGIVVGVAYHGMNPLDSLQTFALLSIGNALVTTLPAFLISTAMGLMVTRVAGDGALGVDLALQLVARPDVLRAAGGLMAILALRSGAAGRRSSWDSARRRSAWRSSADRRNRASAASARAGRERMREERDPAAGDRRWAWSASTRSRSTSAAELYPLLAAPNADALLDRIGDVRRALAVELGLVIPGVRLRDDGARAPETYALLVRDRIVAEGTLRLDVLLAVGPPAALVQLGGEPVREPVYGLEARAIPFARREDATRLGILTFDAISILGSHLSETVRRYASELLGRQEFHTLIEHLRSSVPSLVKDIGGELLPTAVAHRVFTQLLKERAWPRDPIAVIEALLDAAPATRDPRELTEAARRAIVPQQFRRDGTRAIHPLLLDPALEAELTRTWTAVLGSAPDPQTAQRVRDGVARYLAERAFAPHAIVTGAALRPILADFLDRSGLAVDVFAFTELPPEVSVEPAGLIDAAPLRAAS